MDDKQVRLFKALVKTKGHDFRPVLPAPQYSPQARMVQQHLRRKRNPIWHRLWRDDIPILKIERHSIRQVISWQKTVFVSGLISLGGCSLGELQRLMIEDDFPRLIVYGRVRMICDGNHRFWWLYHSSLETAWFQTLNIPIG